MYVCEFKEWERTQEELDREQRRKNYVNTLLMHETLKRNKLAFMVMEGSWERNVINELSKLWGMLSASTREGGSTATVVA